MGGTIAVPSHSLVVLAGCSGSGKSTFARRHFRESAIVSSDRCRFLVGDNERDMSLTPAAFQLFHEIVSLRLARGKLTVTDSTAVTADARRRLLQLAARHDVPAVLILLDVDPDSAARQDAKRRRSVGRDVIEAQCETLKDSLPTPEAALKEGFNEVHVLRSVNEVEETNVRLLHPRVRRPLKGPFDIIGDLHGCREELERLLTKLGYEPLPLSEEAPAPTDAGGGRPRGGTNARPPAGPGWPSYRHPGGRTAIFVGDMTDRGPASLATVRLVLGMVATGDALCVPGNHDKKLSRYLKGRRVRVAYGMESTVDELESLSEAERNDFTNRFLRWYETAAPYLILDGGRLAVAHAGIEERMVGRVNERVRNFVLYGDSTGERTPEGLPIRRDWAADYRGRTLVVYGHTPTPAPTFRNNTANIDQGCCFGGWLTALRYPEKDFVQVQAARPYYTERHPDWINPDELLQASHLRR